VFCKRGLASGGLTASVQNDDKRGRWLEVIRHKREHLETTGIRPESGDFSQRTMGNWPQVSPEISKAIETLQLWQTSQEFDIVGEGHRQLLDRVFLTPPNTDSCCTAK
jgi:hypothetical protein